MSTVAPSSGVKFFRIVTLLVVGGGLIYAVWTLTSTMSQSTTTPETGSISKILEAAANGNVALLERELKNGADKETKQLFVASEAGMTPIMYAARFGNADAVKLLLDRAANVNASAADGRTALMYAAMGDESAVVKKLIDAKANVNARAEDGWTALMLASARGSAETVRALLAAGADVNQRNRWRLTPLMVAARGGDLEKVKALLASGASVDDTDADGNSALNSAVQGSDNSAIITLLLSSGSKPNVADVEGVTPLMRAAERGNADLARALLERGADASLKDRRGWRALEWANNRGDDYGRAIADLLTKGVPAAAAAPAAPSPAAPANAEPK
ncbi:MAG: ankyrin repeat domain-containing protein [Phycisphaerales bacterium]|nr:ankyrin repeat domain-containing protein [Phycisphaerales bacterium]